MLKINGPKHVTTGPDNFPFLEGKLAEKESVGETQKLWGIFIGEAAAAGQSFRESLREDCVSVLCKQFDGGLICDLKQIVGLFFVDNFPHPCNFRAPFLTLFLAQFMTNSRSPAQEVGVAKSWKHNSLCRLKVMSKLFHNL